MASKSTFICPYCFEKHKLSEVQFRCTNRRCKDFPDVEMTRYENGNIKIPKQGKIVFYEKQVKCPHCGKTTHTHICHHCGKELPKNAIKKITVTVPSSASCPKCQNITYKHVCPSCHNELPESTLTGKDMIISIVGSRATGKSHFVGVIIKELRDRISISFGGSLEGFSDSYQRWEKNFGNQLYNNNEKLELTQSSVQNVDNGAYRPLIFKLKLKKKKFLGGDEIESFTFVFFDTAGEDLNDEDTMSTVNKYICKSAGIIFLLDPMQIPAVSNQLEESVVSRAAGIDWRKAAKADDIMTRVSNLIRKDKGMSETQKIDIPVAAVFSKFDVIESLVPTDCTVHNPSPHCSEKCFSLSDWHNVNSEILALLHEWKADGFISQLETNYTTYSYFTASALGLNNNPTTDGRIERPRPHRIEDALLWILKENEIIKGKK